MFGEQVERLLDRHTGEHEVVEPHQLARFFLAFVAHATLAFSPPLHMPSYLRSVGLGHPCRLLHTSIAMKNTEEVEMPPKADKEREERQQEWRSFKAEIEKGDFSVKSPSKIARLRHWGKRSAKFLKRTAISLLFASAIQAGREGFTISAELANRPQTVTMERQEGWSSPNLQQNVPQTALPMYNAPSQVQNPRTIGGWVSDNGKFLSPTAISDINKLAERVRVSTRAELAVVTVPDVSGSPKSFATRLFNYWGVGDPTRNNGVVVLLVPEQKRVEVEIGKGLNIPFNDGNWLQNMEDSVMTPRFKEFDYDGGMLAGVERIVAKLESLSGEELDRFARESKEKDRVLAFYAGVLALGTAGSIVVQDEVSKPMCSRCKERMSSSDGAWDAEEELIEKRIAERLLSPEDRLEQKLGSCSFEIYSCTTPDCMLHRADTARVDGYGEVDEEKLQKLAEAKSTLGLRRAKALFSQYSECKRCSRQTLFKSTTLLQAPREDSTGAELVQSDCANCGFTDQQVRVLPRTRIATIRVPSTGSVSEFKGGSSSGGGKGSSWD